MKIIGQPVSYSEILQRIFYTSVASGLVCTVLLAKASPTVKNLIDSVSTEVDIGPFKSMKALYVIIPLVIGIISRMLKLHDRISHIFGIRRLFDTQYILLPLAEGAGLGTLDRPQFAKNVVDLQATRSVAPDKAQSDVFDQIAPEK